MIGRSSERGSGISVLVAWHDDDDESRQRETHSKKKELPAFIKHHKYKQFKLQTRVSSSLIEYPIN